MTELSGTTRRGFMAGSGAAALSLKYAGTALAQTGEEVPYGAWEDLMREKWTWDRVAHGSHGTNCQGGCPSMYSSRTASSGAKNSRASTASPTRTRRITDRAVARKDCVTRNICMASSACFIP